MWKVSDVKRKGVTNFGCTDPEKPMNPNDSLCHGTDSRGLVGECVDFVGPRTHRPVICCRYGIGLYFMRAFTMTATNHDGHKVVYHDGHSNENVKN